ncbi:MAG: hypothetical protein ACTHOB_01855 [Ginsengibacter sp.]
MRLAMTLQWAFAVERSRLVLFVFVGAKGFFATKARRHEGARRGDCHGARDFSVDDEYFLCASQ